MAKLWRQKIQNRLRLAGFTPTRQHVQGKSIYFLQCFFTSEQLSSEFGMI